MVEFSAPEQSCYILTLAPTLTPQLVLSLALTVSSVRLDLLLVMVSLIDVMFLVTDADYPGSLKVLRAARPKATPSPKSDLMINCTHDCIHDCNSSRNPAPVPNPNPKCVGLVVFPLSHNPLSPNSIPSSFT